MTHAQHFMLLLFTVAFIIGLIFWFRFDRDKDFDKWFETLLSEAPAFGFSELEIELFDEIEFYDWFAQGLNTEEALCEKMSQYRNKQECK